MPPSGRSCVSSPATAPRWRSSCPRRAPAQMVAELRAGGYPDDTPVVVAYRTSWPDELTLRCRLDEVELVCKRAQAVAADAVPGRPGPGGGGHAQPPVPPRPLPHVPQARPRGPPRAAGDAPVLVSPTVDRRTALSSAGYRRQRMSSVESECRSSDDLTVIGIDGGELSAPAISALAGAEVVVGAARHLDGRARAVRGRAGRARAGRACAGAARRAPGASCWPAATRASSASSGCCASAGTSPWCCRRGPACSCCSPASAAHGTTSPWSARTGGRSGRR